MQPIPYLRVRPGIFLTFAPLREIFFVFYSVVIGAKI
jgi:hypothetical protein